LRDTLWGYIVAKKQVDKQGTVGGFMAEEKEANCCIPENEASGCCQLKGIHAKKKRSDEEYKSLRNRLKRIEGQVRGIERMLDEDAYCPDILIQTSAVNSALNSFSKVLLSNHIRTCVRNDIKEGNDEVVEELVTTLQKMMK
jgi:DNA-binding FrmR family transcriptional regulator